MDILRKLNLPNCLTLASLFFAWISIILIIFNEPSPAIIVNLLAFTFDLLDGYYARKLKQESVFGRQLDSFSDIFTYIVFSALFFVKYLSPNIIMGILVGFLILGFGGLRLIRFNNEGILQNNGRDYYRGITVVHINLAILVSYFFSHFTTIWNPWLSTTLLIVISPLMLSEIKSYKIKSLWFFGIIIVLFLLSSLLLEYAHIK